MSLFSIFDSPEKKAERADTMMRGIFQEWRLILGMPIASIIIPALFKAPIEETVILVLMTTLAFMPCVVAVVMLIKYLRSIY